MTGTFLAMMPAKKDGVARILGILLPVLACAAAWAQVPADSWDNLKQLQAGQKIEVVDMKLKSYKGTFAGFPE